MGGWYLKLKPLVLSATSNIFIGHILCIVDPNFNAMKYRLKIAGLFLSFLSINLFNSCKKDKSALPGLPMVKTLTVIEISYTSATSGGNITSDGGSPVVSRGICWDTLFEPTVNKCKTIEEGGSGLFKSSMDHLVQNTLYYLRAYAINSAGIAYGNQENFTTSSGKQTGKVSDIDGNNYDTIIIGTQTWMKENLKTTRFNNGLPIHIVPDNQEWYNLLTPGYCWYDNDLDNKTIYGALYNWYTLDSASNGYRNICPIGWHVPTAEDWIILSTYLGGDSVAGGKLKESGIIHWQKPNFGANNETGFTSFPGGCRDFDGSFYAIGSYGFWWSSTEFIIGGALCWYLSYDNEGSYSYGRFEQDGFSVRCIKDKPGGR